MEGVQAVDAVRIRTFDIYLRHRLRKFDILFYNTLHQLFDGRDLLRLLCYKIIEVGKTFPNFRVQSSDLFVRVG